MERKLSPPPEEEEEVSSPIVFQCSKCNLIVGDSFAFLMSNPDAQTITLSAVSNIKRTPDLYTSYKGHDIGSTYILFVCSGCENTLGRFYLTTSTDLDNLREMFTFDIKSITSYELGKARHGKLPTSADSKSDAGALQTSETLQKAIDNIQNEIQKVQHVMCGFDDRIGNLELKRILDEGAMTSVINNSADQSVSKISQKRPHTEML